ncbi:MAG: YcaO-like family protein [Proteobacteria bacterium]|nr:YcaO-like family protein [Pseudomonadota bacterium]
MAKITLSDAFKSKDVADQDKVLSPAETVRRFSARLAKLDLDILAEAVRIDRGRLDIPVYVSACGADAFALTGTKKQMGKGATPAQAEASAVMELAERFSLYAFSADPGRFETATWNEVKDRALPLSEVAKSVGHDPERAARALEFFAELPQRWCAATDLSRDEEILVPFDWFFAINQFNGSCAGNVVAEALCQGVCEVVERHVSALASDGAALPGIRPESVSDPMALELLDKYERAGVKAHLHDMTLAMGVPTLGVVAWDPAGLDTKKSEIVWTAGTAPHPERALCRALTEAAQLGGDFDTGACYVASGLPKPASLSEIEALLHPADMADISALPCLADENMARELTACVAALTDRGYRVLAVDTTHPGLGVPAYYIMVPGARFRERAASGDTGLFTAKMAAGTLSKAKAMDLLARMEKALDRPPYVPFYAGTLYLADEPARALAFFEEAAQRDPHPEEAASIHVYRGAAKKDLGDWEGALAALAEADALDPERTDALNLMGVCCFKLKDFRRAIGYFERVVALNPTSAMDHANLGVNWRELGDPGRAIGHFARALELDPGIEFARESLARLLGQGE